LFLLFNFSSYKSFSQEKPKPEKDEISLPVYVHGLSSKADVEKVHQLLRSQSWVKFIQVEGSPQKHTHLIIKNSTTPDLVISVLKSEGFYILNKTFLDNRETERALVESRKISGYTPKEKFKQ
jgi:hypothetical protein